MDEAIETLHRAAIGIREWASNDKAAEPDVVMACCGDVPTLRTLGAPCDCFVSIPGAEESASSMSST